MARYTAGMLYGQFPKWIDRLERFMPGLGIPNLALYLVGAQAFGFLLGLYDQRLLSLLLHIPSMVLKGELARPLESARLALVDELAQQ